jgi:hypothetical protein
MSNRRGFERGQRLGQVILSELQARLQILLTRPNLVEGCARRRGRGHQRRHFGALLLQEKNLAAEETERPRPRRVGW